MTFKFRKKTNIILDYIHVKSPFYSKGKGFQYSTKSCVNCVSEKEREGGKGSGGRIRGKQDKSGKIGQALLVQGKEQRVKIGQGIKIVSLTIDQGGKGQ